MTKPTQADEKALALNYAFTALVRTLKLSGHLDMDLFFTELAGATTSLERVGEVGAAGLLWSMAEKLTAI